MTAVDPRSRQLSDMAECAYRLGMAFGAAAETAQGTDGWLAYFNAFDRCFFAVRVATALQLRLDRTPAEPREASTDRETLIDRPDPLETERHERDRGYDERDRDRETEGASLPILLRTLEDVVADAEALPGRRPGPAPQTPPGLQRRPDPGRPPRSKSRDRPAGAMNALAASRWEEGPHANPSPLAGEGGGEADG